MTDDEIIVYGRAIRFMQEQPPEPDDIVDVASTSAQMTTDLDDAIDDLALRHPERIRALFAGKLFTTKPAELGHELSGESYMRPDLMSADKIIVYWRGLHATNREAERLAGEIVNTDATSNRMLNDFARAIGELTERQPEQVRGLITNLFESDLESDWELGLVTVGSLTEFDYAFVKSCLIEFMMQEKYKHTMSLDHTAELDLIPQILRDHFQYERLADFNADLMDAGAWQPIMPGDKPRDEDGWYTA